MKRSAILIFPLCIALLICMFGFTACGSEPVHVHEFGEWITTQTPTCTQAGAQERFCSCGERQTVALGMQHNYAETVVKTVTCEEAGLIVFTCGTCGHSYEEKKDAPGHNWQGASCTSPQVCSVCQKSSGDAPGHTYANGACTRCGATHTGTVTVANTLPTTFRSNVFFNTKGTIDAVTCTLSQTSLTVDIDYYKTYDEKGEAARTGFWFYITVYDKDNIPVASDLLAVNNDGVVNQRLHVTYTTDLDVTQDYTVKLSEYYL